LILFLFFLEKIIKMYIIIILLTYYIYTNKYMPNIKYHNLKYINFNKSNNINKIYNINTTFDINETFDFEINKHNIISQIMYLIFH